MSHEMDSAIREANEMMMKRNRPKHSHSTGVWRVEVHNKTTSIETQYFTVTNDVSNPDAERIVACVNALDGIDSPAAAREMLEMISRMTMGTMNDDALDALIGKARDLFSKA